MEKRVIELSKRNSKKFTKFSLITLEELRGNGINIEFEDGIAKRMIIEW